MPALQRVRGTGAENGAEPAPGAARQSEEPSACLAALSYWNLVLCEKVYEPSVCSRALVGATAAVLVVDERYRPAQVDACMTHGGAFLRRPVASRRKRLVNQFLVRSPW